LLKTCRDDDRQRKGKGYMKWHSRRTTILTIIPYLIVTLCTVITTPVKSYSESTNYNEHQIKAAFLFNFAKFVEWPESSFKDKQSPLVLCILGEDPFGESIDLFGGKTVESRRFMVKRITRGEGLEKCQILFISDSEKESIPKVLKAVRQRSILTVGDMKGFAQSGGIINLIETSKKIGFEININAAEQARLKISSHLLKLGRIVEDSH
jgi:hypothetical protein